MMCWIQGETGLNFITLVSVAGCLGYDVLGVIKCKNGRLKGFSCWLFRL
ncbi:hypothetical protein [uncultured Gammaproteobacteria bacterium]|nr:hypothetical protein [uncultured Gammaproteobacteria bacterium]